MKKNVIYTLIIILLSACSSENEVKDTVSSYLKKQMKNPDSFKIESIEIRKDTIPPYLTNDMLSLASETNDALDEYNRYKDRNYLWAEEKYKATQKMVTTSLALQSAYEEALKDDPTVEYVAYVKYSGTNAMGGTISNRAIVIVDNENTEKVLGEFDINGEFIKKFIAIKVVGSKFNYELKHNKFGKIETDGLPYIEQFIINEAD